METNVSDVFWLRIRVGYGLGLRDMGVWCVFRRASADRDGVFSLERK